MSKKQVEVRTHERQGRKVAAHKRTINHGDHEKNFPQQTKNLNLSEATSQISQEDNATNSSFAELSNQELGERYILVYEQPYDAETRSTEITRNTKRISDRRAGETLEEYRLRTAEQRAIEQEAILRYKNNHLQGVELDSELYALLKREAQYLWEEKKEAFFFPLVNGWRKEIEELAE